MCLRYLTWFWVNLHFDGGVVRVAFEIWSSACFMCCKWLSQVLENITTSSRYGTVKASKSCDNSAMSLQEKYDAFFPTKKLIWTKCTKSYIPLSLFAELWNHIIILPWVCRRNMMHLFIQNSYKEINMDKMLYKKLHTAEPFCWRDSANNLLLSQKSLYNWRRILVQFRLLYLEVDNILFWIILLSLLLTTHGCGSLLGTSTNIWGELKLDLPTSIILVLTCWCNKSEFTFLFHVFLFNNSFQVFYYK